MTFMEWTARAVEDRIIEMADTLRKLPSVKGPKVSGNAMLEVVRRHSEAYGAGKATFRISASAASIGRMEQCFDWINALPEQRDRELIYAWSWVKVRRGLTIGRFAQENDMSESTLRRAVTAICQRVAENLNQKRQIRLLVPDCAVTEIQPDIASTTVTSEKCATNWLASDARPQIDPSLGKTRVLEPRNVRARHSDRNRNLSTR